MLATAASRGTRDAPGGRGAARAKQSAARPLKAKRSEPIKAERSKGPNHHAEPMRLALLASAKARRTAQPKRLSKIGVVLRPFALVTFIWANK